MEYWAAAPARETDSAELIRKSANGRSPVPTTPSSAEIVEMELLRRVYILPSDVCGWFVDFTCEYIPPFLPLSKVISSVPNRSVHSSVMGLSL
jgi:hypothetical protein